MSLKLAGLVLALMSLGQGGSTGSPNVAVVNVALVSEKYARTADLESQFDAKRRRLREEQAKMQERMELISRSLKEELKPGSEAYAARRKELAMLDAEHQYFVESSQHEIEAGLAASLRSIYSDIQIAVSQIANERGIDIVVAGDTIPDDDPPDTPNMARQQILLQKVLYWSPRVDLTADVIARLNASYAADNTAQPVSPTPSP